MDRQSDQHTRRLHYRRIVLWSFLIIVFGSVALPLAGYLVAAIPAAHAQATKGENPYANFWRAVRQGDKGYTAVRGQETNVLIQNGGQNWREIRNGPVATYGAAIMGITVVFLLAFFLIRGRVRIGGGRSGRTIERWTGANRLLHWYTAILFIILAITGLSILFGRAVLVPVLGLSGFAAYAQFAKTIHNYAGPLFIIGVALIILLWMKDNIPTKMDWEWVKQGGGMIGKGKHAPAGRNNAGEKIFTFWGLFVFGIAVSITGLIMDFPNFGQVRETMQFANIIHAASAMLWTCIILGHIYLGTIGTEGSLEGMVSGRVDVNWAKQHNSAWFEEMQHQPPAERAAPGAGAVPSQQGT